MTIEKPKRPGGELYGRPVQGHDGKWYDKFGQEISEQKARDTEYADRFWKRQPPGMRDSMTDNIHRAAQETPPMIGSFVDPAGMTEEDKEKLSAYRLLAEELGYEVGQYVFNASAYTARAEIKKKP